MTMRMLEDEKRWNEIEEIEEVLEKIELFELKKKEEEKEEKAEKVEEEADEELEEKDYEMTTTPPKVSTWINGVDGTISQGVVVIENDNDDDNDAAAADDDKNRCQFNVCPICFESVADNGKHRICCVPCGHIYGFSCINKWLRQPHTSSKGCPQCNKLCTFKDIKRLYSSQLSVPAQTLRKASSTTYYPFTIQGYKAFKRHVSQLRSDVLRLFDDVEKRRVYAYDRQVDISTRLVNIYARIADVQALVDSLGHRNDALGRRVIALGRRVKLFSPIVDALELRGDAFVRLADAMEERVEALVRRDRAYRENILFFRDTYRKLSTTKQPCPKN